MSLLHMIDYVCVAFLMKIIEIAIKNLDCTTTFHHVYKEL